MDYLLQTAGAAAVSGTVASEVLDAVAGKDFAHLEHTLEVLMRHNLHPDRLAPQRPPPPVLPLSLTPPPSSPWFSILDTHGISFSSEAQTAGRVRPLRM